MHLSNLRLILLLIFFTILIINIYILEGMVTTINITIILLNISTPPLKNMENFLIVIDNHIYNI